MVNFQLLERSIHDLLLLRALHVIVVRASLVELLLVKVLDAQLGTDALGLILSLRMLHREALAAGSAANHRGCDARLTNSLRLIYLFKTRYSTFSWHATEGWDALLIQISGRMNRVLSQTIDAAVASHGR